MIKKEYIYESKHQSGTGHTMSNGKTFLKNPLFLTIIGGLFVVFGGFIITICRSCDVVIFDAVAQNSIVIPKMIQVAIDSSENPILKKMERLELGQLKAMDFIQSGLNDEQKAVGRRKFKDDSITYFVR